MAQLTEEQNRAALAAAAARGACVHGQPDAESAAVIAEERAKAAAGAEPMRSAGELAQEAAAAEAEVEVEVEAEGEDDVGTPTAGGGA